MDGCKKFQPGPALLLLSKTGPPFSPSLYNIWFFYALSSRTICGIHSTLTLFSYSTIHRVPVEGQVRGRRAEDLGGECDSSGPSDGGDGRALHVPQHEGIQAAEARQGLPHRKVRSESGSTGFYTGNEMFSYVIFEMSFGFCRTEHCFKEQLLNL